LKKIHLIGILVTFIFPSCNYINNKGEDYLLARIGNDVLYREEVYANLPNLNSNEDSTQLIRSFVDNWVRKKMMEKEVFDNEDLDEVSIEQQLDELRYQLALHQYRTSYIRKNLDSTIAKQTIKEYYDSHLEDFLLRSTIIKGVYTKLPIDAPNLSDVKSMLASTDEHERDEFNDYCYQFATTYHLNDTLWVSLRELLEATPFETKLDKELQFLKNNKSLTIVSDSAYSYFLKINEYQLKSKISPFEFVESRIKNILLNKKRTVLIEKMEKEIYSKAVKDKSFEVFY